MKDFNIDHLEKKTSYKIPENFFEEMQNNVLKETIRKQEHQPKIYKLNFSVVTSLAATLAIVFGFTFLWKTNQTDITKPATEDIVVVNSTTNTETKIVKTKTNINNTETQKVVSEPKQEVAQNETTIIAEQIVNSKNTNENYEQLLNSLTEEELKELSKNTDHDIYLELYN